MLTIFEARKLLKLLGISGVFSITTDHHAVQQTCGTEFSYLTEALHPLAVTSRFRSPDASVRLWDPQMTSHHPQNKA